MRLVVFDCDGTLVDSAAAIVTTMQRAFVREGLPDPAPEAVRALIGLSLDVCVARLVGGDPDLTRRVSLQYRTEFAATGRAEAHTLFPGARQAVTELAARQDVLLGIATGKSRRGLDAILAHHRFERFFVTTQTADDAPSKPHPAMVEQAMAEAGVGPAETIVVGDTTFDMEMALGARAAGIGVTWGSHSAADLRTAGARDVVDSFARLLPAIEGRRVNGVPVG